MQKDKLLLLFPDGIGIRNYIYTDAFDTDKELVLFHNFDPETVAYIKQHKNIGDAIAIPDYSESAKEKFLRELITLSRLYRGVAKTNNPTLLFNWPWKQKTWPKKIFYKVIQALAPRYANDPAIAALEKKYQRAIRQNPFYNAVKTILTEVAPTTVFCSHQRALKAATVFAAAKDLGIPTVTVIYSWDNLPKGRLALQADRYWVWSAHMKQEMAVFFPEIAPEKVIVTGTPQFEFYGNAENIIDREAFYKAYGLNPDKKTICFSGDDEMTSPDDPKYLQDLAEAIVKAGLDNQYQILMRRCPVDFSGRYDTVISRYNTLIREAPPLWNNPGASKWNAMYPLYDDVKLLVSTAFYCDLVINIGSTMAFDFAMFHKPCLFINYDQENKRDLDWSVEKIYRFQHFRSMDDEKAVFWVNNKNDMANVIQTAANTKENPAMEQWKQKILGDYKNVSSNFKLQLRTNH